MWIASRWGGADLDAGGVDGFSMRGAGLGAGGVFGLGEDCFPMREISLVLARCCASGGSSGLGDGVGERERVRVTTSVGVGLRPSGAASGEPC